MPKLKIGFVGCGGIAFDKHLPAMAKHQDVEMYAFCDILEERAKEAASKFGVPNAKIFTDYRQLLQDDSIDAVHVLTPNVMHCEISCASMEAGKHVMCEKPMAATLADAQKMIDTMHRTNKLLTIGYQYRHMDNNLAMKSYIETGALGDIYYAETTAIRRRGIPTWGVFTSKKDQGGGPLLDIATHSLDLTLWMMNNYKVQSVTGVSFAKIGPCATTNEMGNDFGNWDPSKYDLEDAAFGFIRMTNGALINLRCSWALNMISPRSSVVLCGTKGGLDSEDGVRANHVTANRQTLSTISTRNMFHKPMGIDRNPILLPNDAEAAIWVNALMGRGELFVQPEQALTVTRILDAIYRSAQTGETIVFE